MFGFPSDAIVYPAGTADQCSGYGTKHGQSLLPYHPDQLDIARQVLHTDSSQERIQLRGNNNLIEAHSSVRSLHWGIWSPNTVPGSPGLPGTARDCFAMKQVGHFLPMRSGIWYNLLPDNGLLQKYLFGHPVHRLQQTLLSVTEVS